MVTQPQIKIMPVGIFMFHRYKYYPVLTFSLVSRHSMWHAGRATWTLWSVYSEQMQTSIFAERWDKVIFHTSGGF